VVVANRQGRIVIVMRRAADRPLPVVFPAAAAALNNYQGTLAGRATEREQGLHDVQVWTGR
jgi:hypothetical protein